LKEQSRVLLDEQNREYEEALAADREKALKRQQEQEALDREAREREQRQAAERWVWRGAWVQGSSHVPVLVRAGAVPVEAVARSHLGFLYG
jgi:hypothetical protein